MNKNCFIKTSDEEMAAKLREAGFPELAREGNRWVFVNLSDKVEFSDDKKKTEYSNRLIF